MGPGMRTQMLGLEAEAWFGDLDLALRRKP